MSLSMPAHHPYSIPPHAEEMRNLPPRSDSASSTASHSSAQLLNGTKKSELDRYLHLVSLEKSTWGTLRVCGSYLVSDIRSHKRAYFIGVITVMIVVFFITVLQNAVQRSPFIFMRLSELTAGEMDIMLTPEPSNRTNAIAINHTMISASLTKKEVAGAVPRWVLPAVVRNRNTPASDNTSSATTILYVIDTKSEIDLKIGRVFPYRKLGLSECHITTSLARMLGIEPNYGQHVVARIIPSRVFPGIEDMITPDVLRSAIALNQNFSITIANQTITIPPDQQYNFLYQAVRNALINGIDLDFTVVDSIDDPVGKYPSALGNLIMADSTYLLRSISESVSRAIGAQVNLNGLGIRLTDYAFTTVIKLNNRITTYTRNEKERNRLLIEDSNRIALKLGPLVNCKWTFPISLALQASAFVRLFLDQLFNIVLALLVILGSLLIYSLLLNNIDEKTYEYGMLRALGLSARSLLIIMVAYSLMFSIPGVGLGLFVAFLVNIPVSILIGQFSATDPDYELNPIAIGLGVGIGLLIPLLTNIIPISRAFSKSLRDALDVSHRTFSETSVAVQRLEALGIDPLDTAIGITLIVFGVVAYYLIPYSFTFNDMPLFFTILNAILLGMLLGLCLLCQPFEVYLERGFLYFFTRILIRRERNLHNLIKKNMTGHRPRTKKTALMFTIALAFLIFCGVIFSLQAKSIPMAIESLLGSDIVVKARTNKVPLDPSRLSSFLNRWDTKAKIRDYSFATFEAKAARLSNLVGFPRLRTRIIGIDPDKYLRSTYDSYFLVTEERTSDVDFGKGYIPPLAIRSADPARTNLTQELDEAYIRSVTAVISEATRDYMSLDTETPLRENVASSSADDPLRETSESRTYLGVAKQMVKKAPGIFGFSRFAITVFLAPQLVSLDDYSFMTKKTTDFQTCFVRINDLSTNERIDLINAIRNYVDQDNTDVTDVIATVQSTKVATDAILLFFNIVAVITTLLCFLILWLSFIANVKENSWEFGVLRSLGLGVWALIRTYIYEALCLILSSVVLGSIIGLIIALTLSAQFNLFLELPFVFDFPFALFFSVFGMSIVVAFVGSYLPARKLKDQEIAYVIRGL